MKERAYSDLVAECNFSQLPPEQIEAACEYEYRRESKALRDRVKAARSSKSAKREKESAIVLPSFSKKTLTRGELYRLMLALLKTGFPRPWNKLKATGRKQFVRTISEWDKERKKAYSPVAIEEAVLERDWAHEVGLPIWYFPRSNPELLRRGQQRSERKYFYGFIRIDESCNITERVRCFEAWLNERYSKTKGGGASDWRAKLNDLVVMRLWKQFPNEPIERVEHIVKFTIPGSKRVGFQGCRDWWKNHCRDKKAKLGNVDDRMSQAASEEMTKARKDALKYFQSLFSGQRPLSWPQLESR